MTIAADTRARLLADLVVAPGESADLTRRDTGWSGNALKPQAKESLAKNIARLSDAQELLWASDQYALLIVL